MGGPAIDGDSTRIGDAAERRTVLALIAIYWLGFQIVYFSYFLLSRPAVLGLRPIERYDPPALVLAFLKVLILPSELICCLLGSLLCFAIYKAIGLFRRRRLRQLLLAALAASVLGAFAFTLITHLAGALTGDPPPISTQGLVLETLVWFAPIGLWAATALSLVYNIEARERAHQAALFQLEAQKAHFRALQFQVNPHFLFNALNSVSALVLDRRNAEAERMLLALADFFRATLDVDPMHDITLAEEIALQSSYLQIERARFDDRLTVEIAVPCPLRAARVPALLLQPLVENAIKHGLADGRDALRLTIAARQGAADELVVEVRDDGAGSRSPDPSAAFGGIGLANVRSRLAARFGERSQVATLASADGFGVRLHLPLLLP